jgi:hypothetical protein
MKILQLLRTLLYYIVVAACFIIGINFMVEGTNNDIVILGVLLCTSALYNITFHR